MKDLIEKMQEDAELVVNALMGSDTAGNYDLESLLKRDSVAESEKMSESLNLSQDLKGLLMLGHAFRINKAKDNALKARGDSTFSNKTQDYIDIIADMGFEKVLELPFHAKEYNYDDKFFVFWRNGVLIAFDTYYSCESVNGCRVYFNWKPKYKEDGSQLYYPMNTSGGFNIKDTTGQVSYSELYPNYEKTTNPEVLERERLWNEKFKREAVWSGYFDGREAVRYHLGLMETNGDFLPTWEFKPFIWFLHYADTKVPGYDYEQINKERIAMLPEHVRNAITPKEN
jgi:hypothetical protein